jgi:methionyl aminopeptidase
MTRLFSRHLCRSYRTSLAPRSPNTARLMSTQAPPGEEGDLAEQIRVFGTYIPVLSANPLASGTSHIHRKAVPAHIPLPPYARPAYRASRPPPYQGNGLIKLGTDEERRVRRAGALAAMTLNKAELLVRVGALNLDSIDPSVMLLPARYHV